MSLPVCTLKSPIYDSELTLPIVGKKGTSVPVLVWGLHKSTEPEVAVLFDWQYPDDRRELYWLSMDLSGDIEGTFWMAIPSYNPETGMVE